MREREDGQADLSIVYQLNKIVERTVITILTCTDDRSHHCPILETKSVYFGREVPRGRDDG